MKIYIDDKFLAIFTEDKNIEKSIKDFFTYNDMSNVYLNGKYDKKRIKQVSLIKNKKGWLLTDSGFLKEFVDEVKKLKIKIDEVKDTRTKFLFQKKEYSTEELNPYFPFNYNEHQVSALKTILKLNRGLIVAPTSAGKSSLFFAYIKMTKIPTLLLVNKITLANQLYEGAIKYGIENVGVWSSEKKIKGEGLMIATIGSVLSLPSLAIYKCLISDEVHNTSAKTFQDFLMKVSYPIQLGFSATPNKGDAFKFALIRRFFGSIQVKVESEELLNNGVMAKPIIYFIKNKIHQFNDYQDSYLNGIIKNVERNKIILTLIEHFHLPTLILIQDVVNGQGELLKEIIEEDKRVEFISGNSKDRNEIIDKLENNEIDVLIATNILNEGISIKNIKLLINASGQKSFSATAQKIGRGLRIKEGKETVAVIDFTDEDDNYLERHSKTRMKIFKKLGFTDIREISIDDIIKYTENDLLKSSS